MIDIIEDSMIEVFSSVGKILNTEFVQEVSMEEIDKQINEEFKSELGDVDLNTRANEVMTNISSEVTNIGERKQELENTLMQAKIKDSGFLEMEIKSLILSSKRVLTTLENDIKIGASPRMYEVYATLLNSIIGQYKELRNLNESIAKFVLENKKQNLDETKVTHQMMMSSNDLLSMYNEAKNTSNMDAIDADFDVE